MASPTLLLVNKYYHDRGPAGGVGRYLLQEEEDLQRAGWNVVPFAMADADARPGPWREHFVRARDYSRARWSRAALGDAASLVWNREAARRLDGLIRAARPDVAHLHNVYHHLSPSILPVLARHRIPAAMTLHDLRLLCPAIHMLRRGQLCERCRGGRFHQAVLGACVKESRAASLLAAVETAHQRWRRLYERHVAVFLCPSRFLLEKHVAWGFAPDRLRHLPNFVDTGWWRPPPDAAPVEDAYLYFGRLSREKGLTTLLEAHARWEAAGPGTVEGEPPHPDGPPHLWIAGSGPQEDELRRRSGELRLRRVEFLGSLEREELRRRLWRCRFTVIPSEWYENAPMAVLESLAAGRPVVGTSLGGIPELVQDGRTGVLAPARDPAALLQALRRARALPSEAATAARLWAETHARRDQHMERLAEILAGLAV
ncbi:MAG: glycosyltransferase [Candidatus Krumholzibacteriia bacterium]